MTVAIVDSGFIYSVLDVDDVYHAKALAILKDKRWELHIPHLTLVEVFHTKIAREQFAHRPRRLIVRDFANGVSIVTQELGLYFEEITPSDYERVTQLLHQYADSNVDYVDAVVVAMAERFATPYIMTIDERDFRRYIPSFTSHFILPVFDM